MNTKQIPFRYPEELEKDFTEILEERGWRGTTKNQTLQKAVKNQARLKRVAKLFIHTSSYCGEGEASIENVLERLEEITEKKGKRKIEDLKCDITSPGKTDIKKHGRKK